MSKKSLNRQRTSLIPSVLASLLFTSIVPLGLVAQTTPTPTPAPKIETESARPAVTTDWKGVEVRPLEIKRLPGNLLYCRFLFENRADSNFTAIVGENIRTIRTFSPGGGAPFEEPMYDLYDISKGAMITEEATGFTFQVDKAKTDTLPNSATSLTLAPGNGSSMSLFFPCPPLPPLEPGKKPPKQSITIKLPKVLQPFRDIPVPREDNDVVKFNTR